MTALVEVRKRRLLGSPHWRHQILVNGREIHAQISPYTEAEVAERVANYAQPFVPRPFVAHPKARPGPKPGQPKKATVNARGFLWEEAPE